MESKTTKKRLQSQKYIIPATYDHPKIAKVLKFHTPIQ